jgi:hypothetical protein
LPEAESRCPLTPLRNFGVTSRNVRFNLAPPPEMASETMAAMK